MVAVVAKEMASWWMEGMETKDQWRYWREKDDNWIDVGWWWAWLAFSSLGLGRNRTEIADSIITIISAFLVVTITMMFIQIFMQ